MRRRICSQSRISLTTLSSRLAQRRICSAGTEFAIQVVCHYRGHQDKKLADIHEWNVGKIIQVNKDQGQQLSQQMRQPERPFKNHTLRWYRQKGSQDILQEAQSTIGRQQTSLNHRCISLHVQMQKGKGRSLLRIDHRKHQKKHKGDVRIISKGNRHSRPFLKKLICKDNRGNHEILRRKIQKGNHRQEERTYSLPKLLARTVSIRQEDAFEDLVRGWP